MLQACSICLKNSEDYQLYKLSASAFLFFISCATQHSSKLILQHLVFPSTYIPFSLFFPSTFLPISLCYLSPLPRLICQFIRFIIALAQSPAREVNMRSLHYAAGLAGILFSLLQTTIALPTSDPASASSTLFPRILDRYVDCSDDQQKKLGQGFADAATLARWTFDHPISLGHTAYVLPGLLL